MAYFINGVEVSKEAFEAWAAGDKKSSGGATSTPTPTPTNDSTSDSQTDTQTGSGASSAATPTPTDDSTPESQADAQTEPEASLTPEESEALAMAQKLGFERAQAEIDKLVEQDPFYALFTWDVSVNTTLVYETINDFDDIAAEFRPGLAELEWEKYNSYAGVPTDYRDDLLLKEMEEEAAEEEEADANTEEVVEEVDYSIISEAEREEMYNRLLSLPNIEEDGYAATALRELLNSPITNGMDTVDLMLQFAVQFTGTDQDRIKLSEDSEENYDLLDINWDDGSEDPTGEFKPTYDNWSSESTHSLDTHDMCSGFTQDLYYIFFNLGLHRTDVITVSPADQFWTEDKKYASNGEINPDNLKKGDLVFYDYSDESGSKNPDHVVMYLGYLWDTETQSYQHMVIEQCETGEGVTINILNSDDRVRGYRDPLKRNTEDE